MQHGKKRQLKDAVAIVTGAGSGIGAAVCAQLAQAGAKIVLIGRNADKLQQVQQTLATDTLIINGDVGDSVFCRRAIEQTITRFNGLNILINNAGVMRRGTAAETSDDDWAEVMRVNVNGVFYMSRAAVGVMHDGGVIVNTASTCGLVGAAGLAAYCTSKGAVVQLTRTMALECAAQKITVNAVCPGAVESPMLFSAHADTDGNSNSDNNVRQRNINAIPLRQIAAADDVARAIVYLAGEPHVTGTMLSVDGGYTAQ